MKRSMTGEMTMGDGNRNQNPFRKRAESEELNIVEENRFAIVGIIEHIDKLEEQITDLKKRIEVIENGSKI